MSYSFPPDVAKLVQQHLATGAFANEDDVLREALDVLGQFALAPEAIDDERRQTIEAVREGLADMEAGRMRPLRELIDEARESTQHGNE